MYVIAVLIIVINNACVLKNVLRFLRLIFWIGGETI